MEENSNRLIIFSILAYAIGTFLFGAGLLTKATLSIVTFYIVAMTLIICAMLALFNNYKKYKYKIYLYLFAVGIIFIILNTSAFINNLI